MINVRMLCCIYIYIILQIIHVIFKCVCKNLSVDVYPVFCVCVQFLLDHKLKGNVKNVVKTKTKEQLADDYKEVFSTKVTIPQCLITTTHTFNQSYNQQCHFWEGGEHLTNLLGTP